ncbi:MAG: HD domain-containing protein, partial [Candidatus Paceibacterota bacterium]
KNILSAAWLHDVIEDCGVSKECIGKEFNPYIAKIVWTLTRNVDREKYIERIKTADYAVNIIKLADTVHNCSDLENLGEKNAKSAKTIERKVDECEALYFSMAERICPEFHRLLSEYLAPYLHF